MHAANVPVASARACTGLALARRQAHAHAEESSTAYNRGYHTARYTGRRRGTPAVYSVCHSTRAQLQPCAAIYRSAACRPAAAALAFRRGSSENDGDGEREREDGYRGCIVRGLRGAGGLIQWPPSTVHPCSTPPALDLRLAGLRIAFSCSAFSNVLYCSFSRIVYSLFSFCFNICLRFSD